jgi:hypothetical protein
MCRATALSLVRGAEGRRGRWEATVVRMKIGEGTKVGRGAARRQSCG